MPQAINAASSLHTLPNCQYVQTHTFSFNRASLIGREVRGTETTGLGDSSAMALFGLEQLSDLVRSLKG
jgi:hypothetical protein